LRRGATAARSAVWGCGEAVASAGAWCEGGCTARRGARCRRGGETLAALACSVCRYLAGAFALAALSALPSSARPAAVHARTGRCVPRNLAGRRPSVAAWARIARLGPMAQVLAALAAFAAFFFFFLNTGRVSGFVLRVFRGLCMACRRECLGLRCLPITSPVAISLLSLFDVLLISPATLKSHACIKFGRGFGLVSIFGLALCICT